MLNHLVTITKTKDPVRYELINKLIADLINLGKLFSWLLDKLRSLLVYIKFHRYFGRVWKWNVRGKWLITARSRIEQFRRTGAQLSAHIRGYSHASGDEHVATKSDNRGAGKILIDHFQQRRSDFFKLFVVRYFTYFITYCCRLSSLLQMKTAPWRIFIV